MDDRLRGLERAAERAGPAAGAALLSARLRAAVVADLLPWALSSAGPLAPPGSGR